MGHICFSFGEGTEASVMTGDTLFVGGCGKFFEGSAQDVRTRLPSNKINKCYMLFMSSELDTDTVEWTVKTLLNHLVALSFNSPVNSLRASYLRVEPYTRHS